MRSADLDLAPWRTLVAAGEGAPSWFFADNGFVSSCGMRTAHEALVTAVMKAARPDSSAVIDLGCGNGALLAAICDRVADLRPIGVERDAARLARAAVMIPGGISEWHRSDIFACTAVWTERARRSIVLLMLGRLLEAPRAQAEGLRAQLRRYDAVVLGYAYSDWMSQHGGLAALCRKTGAIPLEGIDAGQSVVPVAL